MNNDDMLLTTSEDEYLDILIQLSFKTQESRKIASLVAESEEALTSEEEQIAKRAYALFKKKLDEKEQKYGTEERKRKIRRVLTYFINWAAIIIVLMAISAPIALANLPSLRVKTMQMLINMEKDHVSVGLVDDTSLSMDVPNGWCGMYYPAYIPDGYVVDNINAQIAAVEYKNDEGGVLSFDECGASDQMNIDCDDAVTSYKIIGGMSAFVVERESSTAIAWSNGEKLFVLDADLPEEELEKIVKSVRCVE